MVTYGGSCYVCSTSHTSGATFDGSKWVQIAAAGTAPTVVPVGQCVLAYSSASQLLLKPLRGNQIWVNGAFRTIPAPGWTLANTGLAAGTLHYVYAPPTGTALEASTTGHVTDATYGHEVKSGDATRTLVGMIYTGAGSPGTFVDSPSQRYVRSWFNPTIGLGAGQAAFTADRSTTSTTYVEINAEIRVGFLTWAGETVALAASGGSLNSGTNQENFTAFGIDGTTAEDAYTNGQTYQAGGDAGSIGLSLYRSGLSEGVHYATLLGRVSGNTGTWRGSATAGARTTLGAMVR